MDISKLQYGAWLRGEAPRRSNGEFIKDRQEDGRFDWGWSENKAKGSQAREKYATEAKIATRKVPESTHPSAGTGVTGNGTNNEDQSCQVPVSDHEKGKGNGLGEKTNGILPNSCKENFEGSEARKASIDGMQGKTTYLNLEWRQLMRVLLGLKPGRRWNAGPAQWRYVIKRMWAG